METRKEDMEIEKLFRMGMMKAKRKSVGREGDSEGPWGEGRTGERRP